VRQLREGDLTSVRSSHDVVVVLVTQSRHCPKCLIGYEALLKAAAETIEDPTGAVEQLLGGDPSSFIQFSMIDEGAEGEEAKRILEYRSDLNRGHTDAYRQRVPCMLIFKKHHQEVLKKPPVEFKYSSENLNKNLAQFVVRMVGPDIPRVLTEAQLITRITSPFTNRVSVGVWTPEISPAVTKLAVEGRFEVLWHHLDVNDFLLQSRFNPNRSEVVFYYYSGDEMHVDHLPVDMDNGLLDVLDMGFLSLNLDPGMHPRMRYDKELRVIRRELNTWLGYRPGYEFDHITEVTIIDDSLPPGCGENALGNLKARAVLLGDIVEVNFLGTIVGSGEVFAETRREVVVVGSLRGDYPDILMKDGLIGMCVGGTRRLGVPASQGYPPDRLPPGVVDRNILVFSIEMLRFADIEEVREVKPRVITGEPPPDELLHPRDAPSVDL
jgi:hypothetical protein